MSFDMHVLLIIQRRSAKANELPFPIGQTPKLYRHVGDPDSLRNAIRTSDQHYNHMLDVPLRSRRPPTEEDAFSVALVA